MASPASDPLWFFTPVQIATTVIAGMNCGASALQSPLTWPMLQYVDVPIHYVGRQTENLLHGSEMIFPPFNGICTLANLVLSGFAYYNRDRTDTYASAKLPLTALAFGLHVATTVYTLTIMAPYNEKLKVASRELNRGVDRVGKPGEEGTDGQKKSAEAFRDAQVRWKTLNYGRGIVMLSAAIANAMALKA
ncbi:hypothetical protein LTR36_005228 [Oleoguttula mirabilis]|uniref:DUF1772-domain-containing protein n=1 Tax=Oleoguttula mirabilis TaxID=1507867 RepID=A0AAV9JW20_9PEZI|nr:hypothetical protein LTR36_005228 [Oleoguttula mirabilis]